MTAHDNLRHDDARCGLRRRLVLGGLACIAFPAAAQPLGASTQCRRTAADALGPFYRPNQPVQTDLCMRPVEAARIEVSGRVLAFPQCAPVPAAMIEVWHADARGDYSRVSSHREDDPACLLRGTLRSAEDGTYQFRTLDPGLYPGRPRHIHFRVTAAGFRPLVTQMYFPDEKGVDATLLARTAAGAQKGAATLRFDIVIAPV